MKRLSSLAAIAAIALTGIAPVAGAQASWPIIYSQNGVKVALDTAGAKRNSDGSYITRTRWDYSSPRRLESKRPYTQMTEVALVRCTPVRIKRLTESFYAENGAVVKEGSMPDPSHVQYMSWDRPKLRSDGARAFANVCSTLAKRTRARR
ncbi:MAG TPA: surface-adhesin E family protein [Gemmatimonadaceae bacterium]|nr:surface-adhesin E family protein [Gemmatimonadaceae bacterium]